ncbi:hypothetical protein MAR_019374, partial [Mya arenaria]
CGPQAPFCFHEDRPPQADERYQEEKRIWWREEDDPSPEFQVGGDDGGDESESGDNMSVADEQGPNIVATAETKKPSASKSSKKGLSEVLVQAWQTTIAAQKVERTAWAEWLVSVQSKLPEARYRDYQTDSGDTSCRTIEVILEISPLLLASRSGSWSAACCLHVLLDSVVSPSPWEELTLVVLAVEVRILEPWVAYHHNVVEGQARLGTPNLRRPQSHVVSRHLKQLARIPNAFSTTRRPRENL